MLRQLAIAASFFGAILNVACVEWSTVFNGPTVQQNYMKTECTFKDKPICCGVLDNNVRTEPLPGSSSISQQKSCTRERKYIPSPYEKHSWDLINEVANLKHRSLRENLTASILYSPVEAEHSKRWLQRVAVRMNNPATEVTDDDNYYLSRFEVTSVCGDEKTTWTEWIEPLTFHFRHPFAFTSCRWPQKKKGGDPTDLFPRTDVQATDYVLVKNGRDPDAQHAPKNIIVDAGSSRFDSSLWWFLCAYDQNSIVMNDIYGFEYSLLEPVNFWDHVPEKWFSSFHFYNTPIAPGLSKTNPLQLIQRVATPSDFVVLKLDVDTAEVEIPIAQQLMRTPELVNLVDEFFFELHFQCEYMLRCGWSSPKPPPHQIAGLKLNRPSAWMFFSKLRQLGIRAHAWV